MPGANNFPFRKRKIAIDVELPDGTGDREYLAACAAQLPEIWRYDPRIVFFQSAVDTLASDKLGRLSPIHDGLKRGTRWC